MDVPPIADAMPDPVGTPAPPPGGVERRLADLEAGVAEMNERLDALAVSLEASLREAVTQEVQVVSGELRHTVAELGRLLVRDLGRLSKLLADHRDAIVAELGGAAPGGAAARSPAPATPGAAAHGTPPSEPSGAGGAEQPGGVFDEEAAPADVEGEASADEREASADGDGGDPGERQRRSRLRRRHS